MGRTSYEVPAALVPYLSTDLNSLADTGTFVGGVIGNVSVGNADVFMSVELNLAAQASARVAGGHVKLYLLPSLDDTNYNYGDAAGLVDGGTMLCSFGLDATTNARRVVRVNLPIPPLNFKLQVENLTGQPFAASGTALNYRIYSIESE